MAATEEARRPTVNELIDELPFGRFHIFHVARQLLQNACVAIQLELVPYIFPGMAATFGVPGDAGLFAAVFTGGAIIGAAMVSLQDSFGRRPVILWGAVLATALIFVQIPLQNWGVILAARFLLGAAFSFQQFGFAGWFTEFLPRINRGPLYAGLTAGARRACPPLT